MSIEQLKCGICNQHIDPMRVIAFKHLPVCNVCYELVKETDLALDHIVHVIRDLNATELLLRQKLVKIVAENKKP